MGGSVGRNEVGDIVKVLGFKVEHDGDIVTYEGRPLLKNQQELRLK